MRSALALAGTIAAIVVAAGSCLVDRKTTELRCGKQSDCTDGRLCNGGFCVSPDVDPDGPLPPDVTPCPSPCDTCDLVQETCTINCNTANECGNVTCPAGFVCTINCDANACENIDCTGARGCDIDCDGNSACGAIECGTGRCDVTCAANGGNVACGAVNCAQSCDCDVDCDGGTDCASATCPPPAAGTGDCTDGTAAGCDHTSPDCERTCP